MPSSSCPAAPSGENRCGSLLRQALWVCVAVLAGCSTSKESLVHKPSFTPGVPLAHVVFTREHNASGQGTPYEVYDAGENIGFDTLMFLPGTWSPRFIIKMSRAELFQAKMPSFSCSFRGALERNRLVVSGTPVPDYDCIVLGQKGTSTATLVEAIRTLSPAALCKDERFSFVAWPGTPEREMDVSELVESAPSSYRQPPIAWLRYSWNCALAARVGAGKTVEWDRPIGEMRLWVDFASALLPICTAQLRPNTTNEVRYDQKGLNPVKGTRVIIKESP